MLMHLHEAVTDPARVVVLGAGGFIGRSLVAALEGAGIAVLAPSRAEMDLARTTSDRLAALLRPDDALVMLAALTPDRGRDVATTMTNLSMGQGVCGALEKSPVAHVVYVSSDAVYPLSDDIVDESTPAAPADLYGTMHLMREAMFRATVKAPLAILRPTLVYGAEDTHNAYGPNRLRRMARQEGRITLFGSGEDKRDHIFVDDVVRLILLVLRHRSSGILNLATGTSVAYRELAAKVAALFDTSISIDSVPRQVPITHRLFDTTRLKRAFPDFAFEPLDLGLEKVHRRSAGSDPGDHR